MTERLLIWIICLCQPLSAIAEPPTLDPTLVSGGADHPAHVLIVHDPDASRAFTPRPEIIKRMVDCAITNFTGKATVALAWSSLVSTNDTVGIKVFAAPGRDSGTRPSVAAAIVQGLLEAKLSPRQIIIWDRQMLDLRLAGFFELAERFGIRVMSSEAAGYDENVYYDPPAPLLGQLAWGDLEFGRKGEAIGRRSYVSKLLTKEITKIINVTPMLRHNYAGVAGNLYGLAVGSVDNTMRFENNPQYSSAWLATAVPEIYNLPALADRVVLNIVDALISQYEGGTTGRLHYSRTLNELRFSKDPVALDVLSFEELERQRGGFNSSNSTNVFDLFLNASVLDLGVSDIRKIQVERIQ